MIFSEWLLSFSIVFLRFVVVFYYGIFWCVCLLFCQLFLVICPPSRIILTFYGSLRVSLDPSSSPLLSFLLSNCSLSSVDVTPEIPPLSSHPHSCRTCPFQTPLSPQLAFLKHRPPACATALLCTLRWLLVTFTIGLSSLPCRAKPSRGSSSLPLSSFPAPT